MHPITILLLSLLPLVASPRPVPAAPAPQQTHEELLEKFRRAQEIGAFEEMVGLLKQNEGLAVITIVETCSKIADSPTPRLEKDMEGFRKAWQQAYGTEFVDRVYKYFSLLPRNLKDEFDKARRRFDRLRKEFVEAETKEDVPRILGTGMEFEGFAGVFEELGEHYHASESWIFVGKAFDDQLVGDRADLERAYRAYRRAVEEREALDLRDRQYVLTKQRAENLAAMGYGGGEETGGEPAAGAEPEAGAAIRAATSFEIVKEIGDYVRPSYYGDEAYGSWASLYLRAKGSSAQFSSMQSGPQVTRTESAKVMIDQDLDGEHDVELPTPGRITPVTLTIGSGEEERQWGFLSMVGGTQDTFNGIQYNMAPDDDQMTVYVAPAASVVTEIDGVEVRVLDDNMDGVYGSAPLQWGHTGTIEGSFQQDMDSMVIGRSKRAVPWSEYQKIGDSWYQLESTKGGREIVARPVQGIETGTLKLSYRGPSVSWLVVRGSGRYENSYFDVMDGGRSGIEVPAGRYTLVAGLVSKGKKQQTAKALILPVRDTRAWTVSAGETAEMELGSPFSFDFLTEQSPEEVTIVGKSVHVVGRGGESYQRFWNCVVEPEVSVRKEGGRRGSRPEDMKRIEVQDDITQYGFDYVWFPRDLSIPKDDEGERYEAQLTEKKNALFGKIESDWKG